MKKSITLILSVGLLVACSLLKAQKSAFIENKGQWKEDFDFKLPTGKGGIFLEGPSVTVNLVQSIPYQKPEQADPQYPHAMELDSVIHSHAYRMTFLKANAGAAAVPLKKQGAYLNYLLGNNPDHWQHHVGLFEEIQYKDLYEGVDIRYYFSEDQNLKYDLIIKPGGAPEDVRIQYTGQEGMKLVYGNLMIYTGVEDVLESAPYAYQWVEGEKRSVACSYVLEGDVLSYRVGEYDLQRELIIDPTLIFSTYTGSTQNNFGYTATFGSDGSAYGGGIVFGTGSGYPTLLAFQSTSADTISRNFDIGITKFSPDGTRLIYSTYLGGNGNEMPYSLLEAQNGDLIILGNTGSKDFPVHNAAWQDTLAGGDSTFYIASYRNGVDLFITRLHNSGSTLVGSSYLGGTGLDGINDRLDFNYGDEYRGDIAEDSQGNIYAVSNTFSSDFPFTGAASVSYQGAQDGVIFSLNADFSQLHWSTSIGGTADDGLFSLKLVQDSLIYAAGATRSFSLVPAGMNVYQSQINGQKDGLLVCLSAKNGDQKYITYNGTVLGDANYFVEYDQEGFIYVFGQSSGVYPVVGEQTYSVTGAKQFLQKFSPDLSQSLRSSVFGRANAAGPNLSPTALMVDTCGNIYLSGWGGRTNMGNLGNGGLLYDQFITPGALQSTTQDSSDFYLMVLDASWEKVNYATYFGEARGNDHVDGGTSRFRKDGTIFQGVCAGCGGSNNFPTTLNAYSRINGTRGSGNTGCNLAVFKLAIEADLVIADVEISKDSACIPYTSNLLNKSYNADLTLVQYPDGVRDTLDKSSLLIDQPGFQTFRFIAIDTTCGFRDSITRTFYGIADSVSAGFQMAYDSCSASQSITLTNTSSTVEQYLWKFGDGGSSTEKSPVYQYKTPGIYEIQLLAYSDQCNLVDSLSQKVLIREYTENNRFAIGYEPCENGLEASLISTGKGFQKYRWYLNDSLRAVDTAALSITFDRGGVYSIRLESEDTLCNRQRSYTESLVVRGITGTDQRTLPNVFTPNGDGVDDEFKPIGPVPVEWSAYRLKVFNRWGTELFSTDQASVGWKGTFGNAEVPQGVYYFLFSYQDECGIAREEKGFVHLFR